MNKENRGEVLHGILLIVLFSMSAFYIAEFEFVKSLSFSPLIVGIVLGMLYANSLRKRGYLVSSFVLNRYCVRVLCFTASS